MLRNKLRRIDGGAVGTISHEARDNVVGAWSDADYV